MKKSSLSNIPVFMLIFVFVLLSFLLALNGASAYKSITESSDASFNRRTPLMFISEKLKRAGADSRVKTIQFGSEDAFVISEEIGGKIFETYIFAANGYLKEASVEKGETVAAFSGQNVCEIEKLDIERIQSGTYEITVSIAGETNSVIVFLKGTGAEE